MKSRSLFSLILILLATCSGAQTNMKSFVPASKAYDIYYPSTYVVDENKEGIVNITNSETGLNITISSYLVDGKITEESFIATLAVFIPEITRPEWKSYKSKFDNLIEGRIYKENLYWVWWGISLNDRIVMISINKKETITDEEIKLLRFMIDNLLVY